MFWKKPKAVVTAACRLIFKPKGAKPKVWQYTELYKSAPQGLYQRTEPDAGLDRDAYVIVFAGRYYDQRALIWMVPSDGSMMLMHSDSDSGEYTLVTREVKVVLEVPE